MDRSAFIRGLLDDPRDPQLPQSVPQNDFGPRAYGLLNALMPDPYEAAGEAVQQFRAGNPIDAFMTMYGAMPATGALKNVSKAAKAAETVSEAAPQRGIIAYHGSPHSFDRFDMSKIGTGEGAQAYGHGLYFAENEGTAKSYKLAGAPAYQGPQVHSEIFDAIQKAGDDRSALELLNKKMLEAQKVGDTWGASTYRDAVNNFHEIRDGLPVGNMYQVRINADPEHFLDWDKPLSEQSPVVQKAADEMKAKSFLARRALNASDATGKTVWEKSRNAFVTGAGVGNDAAASSMLREAGIPGIKYLDQGSRSAGEGSRNYVVFDDNLVEILKKYGLVGLLGGGSAMGALQSPNAQQGAPAL